MSEPFIQQNYSQPNVSPQGIAVTVGTSSKEVVPANLSRTGRLFFHNPGSNTIGICPAITPAGAALSASIGAGSYLLVSGAYLEIQPPNQGAWNAIASSSSSNALTIWVF